MQPLLAHGLHAFVQQRFSDLLALIAGNNQGTKTFWYIIVTAILTPANYLGEPSTFSLEATTMLSGCLPAPMPPSYP